MTKKEMGNGCLDWAAVLVDGGTRSCLSLFSLPNGANRDFNPRKQSKSTWWIKVRGTGYMVKRRCPFKPDIWVSDQQHFDTSCCNMLPEQVVCDLHRLPTSLWNCFNMMMPIVEGMRDLWWRESAYWLIVFTSTRTMIHHTSELPCCWLFVETRFDAINSCDPLGFLDDHYIVYNIWHHRMLTTTRHLLSASHQPHSIVLWKQLCRHWRKVTSIRHPYITRIKFPPWCLTTLSITTSFSLVRTTMNTPSYI